MKRHLVLLVLVIVALSLLSACGGGAPKVDWDLSITGAVSKPLTLSYGDLVKREMVDLKDILMQRSQGEDSVDSWEGPALAPILEEAGASANAKSIVCTASDGYAREIAMGDLTDSIIALKRNGEWTASDEKGPIRIVVPNKPANHWLFQLVEIKVVE